MSDVRIGLLTPVKAAFGAWLSAWYEQVYPDTAAAAEWAQRGAHLAMGWAPGRMVDSVETMLSSLRTNDNVNRPGTSAFVPYVFAAFAQDYTETPGEAGRSVRDPVPFSFPDDTLGRVFRVRSMSLDVRAQVVVLAPEPLTAQSLMAQLALWANERTRAKAAFEFKGFVTEWPVVVVGGDRLAVNTPIGEQVCALALDFTVRATVPMFYAPTKDDVDDGSGSDPGFAVVGEVVPVPNQGLGPPTGVTPQEWAAYLRLTAGRATPSAVGPIVLLPIRED